jgi:hypothetical protein
MSTACLFFLQVSRVTPIQEAASAVPCHMGLWATWGFPSLFCFLTIPHTLLPRAVTELLPPTLRYGGAEKVNEAWNLGSPAHIFCF